MTAGEAIKRVDALKYNTFTDTEKLSWLRKLEGMLNRNLVETHVGGLFYSEPGVDTELLATEPFDEMYLRWIEAQIDLHNGETQLYNASILLFNAEYEAFENWYNRSFPPKGSGRFRF